MPKKVPKVAYAVFSGRSPGIYDTWPEVEKEVKGFSCAKYKGYTVEHGGRARAERDLRGFDNEQKALSEENTKGQAHSTQEKIAKPTIPEEPIRVHVSGRMVQPSMPHHGVDKQLQTPPNTFVERKIERPSSWEVDEDSRKRVKCVGNDDSLGNATGLKSEQMVSCNTSYPTPSVTSSFRNSGNGITECTLASEAAPDPNRTHFTNSNTHAGDLSSSNETSSCTSTSCDGITPLGDTAGSRCNGRVPMVMESEDDSDKSDAEGNPKSNSIYPQLPVYMDAECAHLKEVVPHDCRTIANLPTPKSDQTSPALDDIALDTSTDYGEFPEEVAVPDQISAPGPRLIPPLCDEQLALVELIMNGKNVFYTGSAGCGKSTVLKHIVSLLRKEKKHVDILAPTGRAALEVNGRTLHNYAGWVPSSLSQPLESLTSKARGKKVRKRIRGTDVLIIDEISMVANLIFERLNFIMKSVRDSGKPFGGVQIIATGDFCQLPPVKGYEYCLYCGTTLEPVSYKRQYKCIKAECLAKFEEIDKWAFRSAAWQECNFEHINLNVIHRQKDANLKPLLEKRRLGLPYSVDEKWLLLDHVSDTRDAVKLFPRREDVKIINNMELAKLPGRALTYLCIDDFSWNREHDNLEDKGEFCQKPMDHALKALEELSLEPKLILKEGMPVILVVNWDLDLSLANGSQGTVVGFKRHNPEQFRRVPDKWEYASYKNNLLDKFVERTAVHEWPIVQFLNGNKRTIYPRCMVNELGDDEPYSLLSRTQIPLTAAWAITVHKAQGMTLSRVVVDLKDAFEPGQDYVALSRAETLRGLTVEGLPKQDPGANEQVIQFLTEKNLMPAFFWNKKQSRDERARGRIRKKATMNTKMVDARSDYGSDTKGLDYMRITT